MVTGSDSNEFESNINAVLEKLEENYNIKDIQSQTIGMSTVWQAQIWCVKKELSEED
jgi:hypothetical protein